MNTIVISNALVKAEQFEAAGKVVSAASIYEKLYAKAPDHIGVVKGLARVEQSRGRFLRATKLYQALLKKQANVEIYQALGQCYAAYGAYWLALRVYAKILRNDKASDAIHRDVLVNKSKLLLKLKRFSPALSCAKQAIALQPDRATNYMLVGDICYKQDDLEGAVAAYVMARDLAQRSVSLDSLCESIRTKLSICYFQLNRNSDAIDVLLLSKNTSIPTVANNERYSALFSLATDYLNKSMLLHAHYVLHYLNDLKPQAQTLVYEAVCIIMDNKFDDARELLSRALELEPDSTEIKYRSAQLSYREGDYVLAVRLLNQCLSLDPQNLNYKLLKGQIHECLYQFEEGKKQLSTVLKELPDNYEAQYPLAFIGFTQCDWKEGFHWFSTRNIKRRHTGELKRVLPNLLEWDGQEKIDKLLLVDEQGVGDKLRYAVFYELLCRDVKEVYLVTDIRLKKLIEASFPNIKVFPQTDFPATKLAIDNGIKYFSAPADLGKHYWMNVFKGASIPYYPHYEHGFLSPDVKRREYWLAERRKVDAKISIGVCWRSPVVLAGREDWYMSVDDIVQMFTDVADFVDIVVLQHAADQSDIDTLSKIGAKSLRCPDLDLKDDFDGMAALIANLDLVITPATAIAELSGALGVPTWLYAMQDRKKWNLDGDYMKSFYPKLDIMFSTTPWADVVEKVGGKLRYLVGAHKSQ